ncbi:MAG: DUF2203 domain-containing protein [Chloroflexota bacterium]|nr:DUF2203 domain-containing protein [Chloroflexota bacterium]
MRYFTVEEANEMLPTVEGLVAKLIEAYNRIMRLRPEVVRVLEKSETGSGSATASQMYLEFLRFESLLQEINKLGVEVKDPESGLCDFPALHRGRDIYLCWQFGEQQVEWWHELHTGYAGRRHVNELL